MKTTPTKTEYERHLDDLGTPPEDLRSNGGRIPDHTKHYGAWMRANDPIAFSVGYNEWAREIQFREENTRRLRSLPSLSICRRS